MNDTLRISWIPILTLLLAGITLWGCEGRAADIGPQVAPPRPAKIFVVASPDEGSTRVYPGKARASQTVSLAFRVAGPLVDLPVNEGQVVEAGTVLARIDPRDYRVRVRTLEAELSAAEVQAADTRLELQRVRGLFEYDSVSKSDFDRARAARDVALAQVEAVSQSLAAARLALEDTTLRSPFRGVVASRRVENHETVAVGQPVFRLQDDRNLEIVIDVPEGEIAAMTETSPALLVSFDAIPGRSFAAQVSEYATETDASTQTYSVVLELTNPADASVLPGMTATVTSQPGTGRKVGDLRIPVTALGIDEQRQIFIWKVDPQAMTISKQVITTGELGDQGVVVRDGLTAGDQILATGVGFVVEGQQVRRLNPTEG